MPGKSGNPTGRPQGSRNRATLAAEALLDGQAEAITSKVIALALAGDNTALRLCMDRILPPRRERPVMFAMPDIMSAHDAPAAITAIARSVADGEITPAEAADIAKLITTFTGAQAATDFDQRLRVLEEKP